MGSRFYNSETDYDTLLAHVQRIGETVYLPLTEVVLALEAEGITARGYAVTREPWAVAFDRDIGRAWKAIGHYDGD